MNAQDRQPGNQIQQLILRFLEGSASEQDIATLTDWLKESRSNQEYFDEVNTTYQASVTVNRFNTQKTDEAWTSLMDRIDEPRKTVIPLYAWFLRVAASVLFLAAAWYLVTLYQPHSVDSPKGNNLVKNSPGRNTRIVLPDSSIVYLNTNSTLEYPSAFGDVSREVYLKGEAYFDVRKGSRPFIVRTENMVIRVKGTRFNVQDYKNETDVRTTLEEGSVELLVSRKQRIYSLTPGDQVVLNTERSNVSLRKVDPSHFTAWKEEKLVFDNTPLQDIVYKLENRFRVNIIVEQHLSKSERLTMTITNETLDEVLDLIQLSSRFKVKKEINDVIIYE